MIAYLNCLDFSYFHFYRWRDFSSENPSPATSSRYIIGVIAKVSEELLTQRGLKGGRGILLFEQS